MAGETSRLPVGVTERTAKVCAPFARLLYVTPLEGQLSNSPPSSWHSNVAPATSGADE